MTPAERLEKRRRRAARKARKRQRRQQIRRAATLEWLRDGFMMKGWEMQIYGFTIPLSAEAMRALRERPGSTSISSG